MTFLLLAGAIGFCTFIQLYVDDMPVFRVSKKKQLLFVTLSFLVSLSAGIAANVLQLNDYLALYLVIFAATVVIAVFFKSIYGAVMALVYSTGYIFGISSITLIFLRMIGLNPGSIWIGSYGYYVLVALPIILVLTLMSVIIRKILKKYGYMDMLNMRVIHLMLASAGIIQVFIYASFVMEGSYIFLGWWIIYLDDIVHIMLLAVGIAMFATIYGYVSREGILRTEKLMNTASQKYIHDLEESYRALRTIKHDYVNILTSFKLYIDNKDIDGLAKYYYDELSEMNKDLLHQDKLIGSLQNVQLNEVKSILIYKLSLAAQQGIDTNIEAPEPIETLGVSAAVICQILGILLDNALEAIAEADEKKLHIAIVKNPNSKAFIVKNSWKKQDTSVDKLFEYGFSTKADGHGIGLNTVRSYTEKNKSLYIETKITDEYFTQILTVKDN